MKRVAAAIALVATVAGTPARAADHRDGPAVQADPSTDINDVYAWMSADGTKVNLVMSVFPNAMAGAKFSTSALYVFHVNAFQRFGDVAPNVATVVCSFDAAGMISCWGPDGSKEFATGDASATAGIASGTGKMKVFAGLRDDPFFFNIAGFRAGIGAAASALGGDPGACPPIPKQAAAAVAMLLASNGMGGPPSDGFKKGGDAVPNYSGNVLAIVIQIDKTLLTDATHGLLGVSGSTNKH
jgi:hypothetical protein